MLDKTNQLVDQFPHLEKREETIEDILENPPDTILMHVYWAKENKYGKYTPNAEGRFVIDATLKLISAILEKNPNHQIKIVYSGDLNFNFKGNRIVDITSKYLKEVLSTPKYTDISDMITLEPAQEKTNIANETRGELRYANNFENVLSIGRIPHQARIKKLIERNNFDIRSISETEILGTLYPQDVIERFLRIYSGVIPEILDFAQNESKKHLFMIADRKGAILEALAVFLKKLKQL